jgi:nucleotide-binding universal stress UspA family protein
VAELVLTSVSHRVLLHATQPTLLVKGHAKPIRRVLVAIEGREDGRHICDWLNRHPFRALVEATVLTAVPILPKTGMSEISPLVAFESWTGELTAQAEANVTACAETLNPSLFSSTTRVMKGEPAPVISEVSRNFDLVVVGSHGREGLDRFLLGSVSHAIVHHVACPVLVVRSGGTSSL